MSTPVPLQPARPARRGVRARQRRGRVGSRAALLFAALTAGGCLSAEEQSASADRAAYGLIAERRAALGLAEEPFTIQRPSSPLRDRLLDGEVPPGLVRLELVDCLEIAAENSRTWQDQREDLYLAALDLTLERWRFGWRPSVDAGTTLTGNAEESQNLISSLGLGLVRLLGSGATVIGNIGLNLFDSLISTDGKSLTSNVSLSITQPLLAGFGRRITLEPLTQAQRNLLYEVRSYERFRRTFAFDVASRYWRLLQQRDSLNNELANQRSLAQIASRNEALAEAGRLSDIQLDQARQNLLSADSRVIAATQSEQSALDDFKLFLGLPIEIDLALADDALELLDDDELFGGLTLEPQQAVKLALDLRLDLRNSFDAIVDAERRVVITADALRNVLDLTASGGGTSAPDQPLEYGQQDINWSVGLDFDLAINRIPERNAYRSALIARRAAVRGAEQAADTIRVDVRDALRDLAARAEDLEIQERSILLAERRVESAERNLEAGRAETRDLLEAQDALLAAQNARTRALIDFRLAQVALLRDTETLAVTDRGLGRIDLEAALEPADGAGPGTAGLEAYPAAGAAAGAGFAAAGESAAAGDSTAAPNPELNPEPLPAANPVGQQTATSAR